MQENKIMTRSRRKVPMTKPNVTNQLQSEEQVSLASAAPLPEPTGKIFLGEEDKRLLKKFNQHIVNKLGLGSNRSVKM
jgi:hypothetical protein